VGAGREPGQPGHGSEGAGGAPAHPAVAEGLTTYYQFRLLFRLPISFGHFLVRFVGNVTQKVIGSHLALAAVAVAWESSVQWPSDVEIRLFPRSVEADGGGGGFAWHRDTTVVSNATAVPGTKAFWRRGTSLLWPGAGVGADRGQPMDFAPSRDSLMMSAWPACWAVSVAMCSSVRRADQRAPGLFHGAGGSG
jgi:hypothetical protein